MQIWVDGTSLVNARFVPPPAEELGPMVGELEKYFITLDNGLEFAEHATIAKGLNADIYFAHPYASWERGINENTNGLLCEYFPKGTDFNQVTDIQAPWVIARLNNWPPKTRACKSPNELFRGQ